MSNEIPPIFAISALKGYAVIGSDDRIGKVEDFVPRRPLESALAGGRHRQLAVRTQGSIHPSAVAEVDYTLQELRVPRRGSRSRAAPLSALTRNCRTIWKARLFAHYGGTPSGVSLFAGTSEGPLLCRAPSANWWMIPICAASRR